MFGMDMFNPAVMAFLKQAGESFAQCTKAEAEGRLDKALDRYCHHTRPQQPHAPWFDQRCQLYAAKAYAATHIDGQITWSNVGDLLQKSPAWPPPADANAQGWLFLAYMLGFLYGSDLPADTHQTIERLLPMAARVASAPDKFAKMAGLDMDQVSKMASEGKLPDAMSGLLGHKK
jgi:hypothetical protein